MKLTSKDLKLLSGTAVDAAKRAGDIIQFYSGRDFTVEGKQAGSSEASQVVTEVDLKCQDVILACIDQVTRQYDLGLLIEESEDDLSRFEKDYFWCIDPLDGTLPFIQRQPGYAVSVALVSREGTPVIGVIFDPGTDTLYTAIQGNGAFRNGKPWSVEAKPDGQFEPVPHGGAVISACWVLEQAPAYFMKKPKPEEGGGCLWDYAATACLFTEIGGFFGDSYGQALNLNSRESLYMNRRGVLYASHQSIFELVKLAT